MEDVRGVYYILNMINNKIYIGSSIHVNKRFHEHKSALNNGTHYNGHLQNAWNMYGGNNFEFKIIEEINGDYNDLLNAEQKWIDYYKSYDRDRGYNISAYARGSGGYIVSEETKKKISISHTGKRHSEKTKQMLSEQRKGELNNFYGKKHTEEARKKMSESKRGYTPTEKQLESLKIGRGNKYLTKESREKIGIAHRGEKSGMAKLSEKDVINILSEIKNGVAQKELAKKYKVQEAQISRIKNRQRWGYLYDKMPELYT